MIKGAFSNRKSWLACLGLLAVAAPAQEWLALNGARVSAQRMERLIPGLMEKAGVSALSVAVIQNDRIAFLFHKGLLEGKSGKAVDGQTVFRAASLGKPVFAYLALLLADEGLFDLDQPVERILGKPLESYDRYQDLLGDERRKRLTPRLLLSHQGGFPNWRRMTGGRLIFQFEPGKHFSYSGEGYWLMQFVLEALTGKKLPELAREKLFLPLGMERTSYLRESRFDGDFAVDLGTGLGPLIQKSRREANCAGSMLTRAGDYARFLQAVMAGRGLKSETFKAMWSPQATITGGPLYPEPGMDAGQNKAIGLSWSLGWGHFHSPAGEAFFHIGQEDGCENYAVVFPERRTGLVLLTVCGEGSGIAAAITRALIGDTYSPFTWMRY